MNSPEEAKQRTAEYKEMEEWQRILFEFAPDGYYISDLKGNFIDGNKVAEEMTGYKREELIGKNFLKLHLLSPDEIPKAALLLSKNDLKKPTGPDEFILTRKDGGQVVVEIKTCPVNINGRALVLGCARDITTRKHLEEELNMYRDHLEIELKERTLDLKKTAKKLRRDVSKREQMEKNLKQSVQDYRLLADNVTDIIFTTNMNLNFTYVSPSVALFAGYSVDEVMRLSLPDLLTRTSYDVAKKAFMEELIKEQKAQKDLFRSRTLELEGRHKDGSTIWAEVKMTFVRDSDSQAISILGVIRDIDKRKQAEESLKASEQKYRDIVENSLVMITIINARGNIVLANEAWKEVHGVSDEQLPDFRIFETIHPEDLDTVREQFSEVFEGSAIQNIAFRCNVKDGSYINVLANWSPVTDPFGDINTILCIAKDDTEHKQAEQRTEELYEYEKELRHTLEEEMKKRVEFTRALVHELKTPMTPIKVSSELLLEETSEVNKEPLLTLVQNINRGVKNLDQRIDELLDLARGEIGMLTLNAERLNPISLLREIESEMAPVVSKNGQSLSLELPSSLSVILADEKRVEQVILNLINNALKFTPSGGQITLRAKAGSKNLIVEVQDTGRGVSKKDQSLLFNPYHQTEDGRFRYGGMGLGLALSKDLVELHGGKIWVKSQKGKGSTFGFSIPIDASIKE
ncbi:PAS domain S-box protein [Chloroflexota bacterium]